MKHYAVQYIDHNSGEVCSDFILLTADSSNPLDWDNPVASFDTIEEARVFAAESYESIIGYHNDWKSVELVVIAPTDGVVVGSTV